MRVVALSLAASAFTVAGLFVSVGSASAASFDTEDYTSSVCNSAQSGRRSQAYAHISGDADSSTNKLAAVQGSFSATNYYCTTPFSLTAFGSGSTLKALLTVSTTSAISNCTIGGGINIGEKVSGSLTGNCQLNAAKTKGYLGWEGPVGGKSTYGYSLKGFSAKYGGSGTFTGSATVTSVGPLGTSATVANAVVGLS